MCLALKAAKKAGENDVYPDAAKEAGRDS